MNTLFQTSFSNMKLFQKDEYLFRKRKLLLLEITFEIVKVAKAKI